MVKIFKKKSSSQILVLDKLDQKFKFKRIFFLIANKKDERGNHAHKKCVQAFFSIRGSFYLKCIYANGRKEKIKIKPGHNLKIIKPMTWINVYLKKNNICGVLCDRNYEEKDYIRDFKKFNEIRHRT